MENIRNTKKWIIVLVVGIVLSFFRLVLFCIPTGFSAFRYILQMLYSVGEIMTLQQIVLVLFASRSAKYSYIWIGELILIVVFCLLRFFEVGGILWIEIVSLLICFLYYSSEINGIICLTRVFASKKKVESEQRHYDVLHQKEEKAFYELLGIYEKYHKRLVEDGGFKKKNKFVEPITYCNYLENGDLSIKIYLFYGLSGLISARDRAEKYENTVKKICAILREEQNIIRAKIKSYNSQFDEIKVASDELKRGQKYRTMFEEGNEFNEDVREMQRKIVENNKKTFFSALNSQIKVEKKINRKRRRRLWDKMK